VRYPERSKQRPKSAGQEVPDAVDHTQ
jgi:hypothetical protein